MILDYPKELTLTGRVLEGVLALWSFYSAVEMNLLIVANQRLQHPLHIQSFLSRWRRYLLAFNVLLFGSLGTVHKPVSSAWLSDQEWCIACSLSRQPNFARLSLPPLLFLLVQSLYAQHISLWLPAVLLTPRFIWLPSVSGSRPTSHLVYLLSARNSMIDCGCRSITSLVNRGHLTTSTAAHDTTLPYCWPRLSRSVISNS